VTLNQFVNKYLGHFIDYDGRYGPQCVDMFRQYVDEVLKRPQLPLVRGAANFWDIKDCGWLKITGGVPQAGDIMIWDDSVGWGYGHVAIFLYGNVRVFYSLEQNFPSGAPVSINKHYYSNLRGWMRPC